MLNLSTLTPRSTDVITPDIPRYIKFLEEYLGVEEVTRRLEQINRAIQTESGSYLHHWLLPNSTFWLGLQEARQISHKQISYNQLPRSIERAVEIASKLKILQQSMPLRVWNDLRSRILGSGYLSPIFFEIDTAAHFWQLGYDIEWSEPTGKPKSRIPEFTLTSLDKRRSMVECKLKRADAGRKILRPSFYRLVDELAAPLSAEGYTGKVLIVVPDRMPTNDTWKKQVINAIDQLLHSTNVQLRLDDGTEITTDLHRLGRVIIPAKKAITEAQATKHPYSYLAIFAKEYGKILTNPVIFELKSQKDDHFIKDVFIKSKGC